MARICPLLALAGDHRSAWATPDPRHLCHAAQSPLSLELAEQESRCLTDAHRSCERLLAYRHGHSRPAKVASPAPDATFVSTRLISVPERRRGSATVRGPLRRAAALVVAATAVAAVGVGVASGRLSGITLPLAGPAEPSASTATPAPLETPTPAASPTPTTQPTDPVPTPSATAVPTLAPTATPTRTYVVEEGDTLSHIAALFGSSVDAIVAANGLDDPDRLTVGQVLVIP